MANPFVRATKAQAKARVGLAGPSGSGKTYSALRIATALGGPVAVIDTEHGSAAKYADEFAFDRVELSEFHPHRYVELIQAAAANGYAVLVIDSITHEWSGPGGCLELVDVYAKKRQGNKYAAWADVTPLHNAFIEAIHQAPLHILATMRSKMEYLQTEDAGKKAIQRVGMAPITREGVEYEFDLMLDLDLSHTGAVTKSRARTMTDKIYPFPGEEFARDLLAWLNAGSPAGPEPQEATAPAAEAAPARSPFRQAFDVTVAAGIPADLLQKWCLAACDLRQSQEWSAADLDRATRLVMAAGLAAQVEGVEQVARTVGRMTQGRKKWAEETSEAVIQALNDLAEAAAGAAS